MGRGGGGARIFQIAIFGQKKKKIYSGNTTWFAGKQWRKYKSLQPPPPPPNETGPVRHYAYDVGTRMDPWGGVVALTRIPDQMPYAEYPYE